MTSEHNLDEDILQCRAEINQSLGMNPADEPTVDSLEEGNVPPAPDSLNAADDSDLYEDPLQIEPAGPAPQQPDK